MAPWNRSDSLWRPSICRFHVQVGGVINRLFLLHIRKPRHVVGHRHAKEVAPVTHQVVRSPRQTETIQGAQTCSFRWSRAGEPLKTPILYYCWWTKSCTTWDVQNPINNGIIIILGGAGFLPSTVVMWNWMKFPENLWGLITVMDSNGPFCGPPFETIRSTLLMAL